MTVPTQHSDPSHTSAARLEMAAALRTLGHALVAHQPDDGVIDLITQHATTLTALVEAAPDRPHAFTTKRPNLFVDPLPEGRSADRTTGFPDCVVSGMANPMGIAAALWREGDEAVMQTTLGAAFEGAPGRAHGGIVASLFDETMGLVLSISSTTAFTGRLTVTYRAPTPLGELLEVRAHLVERTGRKITIAAELRSKEALLAEANALFIAVDPEHFFAE